MNVFAAYNKGEIRNESSSGGIFAALAKEFEVVYGVSMSENNRQAIYTRAERNIYPLIGSKYIQAKTGNAFENIKNDLENRRRVLFVGTACYVNGLIHYLGRDYPELVTVDIICHGVPSYKLWEKYIGNDIANSVNFRCKDNGWKNYGMKINGEFIPQSSNHFMQVYLSNIALRPSCYNCICKGAKLSDITIGDYWGINDLFPEMDDDNGTSVVIVRTEKGQHLFDTIKDSLIYVKTDYENVTQNNPMERNSTNRSIYRNSFYRNTEGKDFDSIYKEYFDHSISLRITRKIKSIYFKILKNKPYRKDRSEITSKDKCCGCSACYAICPKRAISMVEDEEGFEYPVIDITKCIHCHKCEQVCPIKNAETGRKGHVLDFPKKDMDN